MLLILGDDTVTIPTSIFLFALAIIGAGCFGVLLWMIIGYIKGVKASQAETQKDVREIRGYIFEIAQSTGTTLQTPAVDDPSDWWGGGRRGRR